MYHAGKDDEALAIAREAEEKMDCCQKEYCQRIPSVEYEIRYIISRLFLKKEDTENARKYAELLKEYDEGEQLDFWQKGQMLLLRGDLLFAEEEYETAKDIYITASSYWREYHEAVKENVKTTVGFQLRDGKITRDTVNRLWHVKTFYYYLYALLRKAKTKCEGRLGESFCDPAGEYKYVYKMCIEGVKEEVYRPVAEAFMFRAMDKMLEFGKEAQWKGIDGQEILSFLCQLITYGKEKNLNMDRQYEVLADAFCHCDLYLLPIALAFLQEAENCWLDIYQYLKQKIDEGMVILPCNRYLIGYMWMRMGCYEEACLWLDAIPEEAPRYKDAKHCSLFCHAMCACHDKEKEKFSEAMEELEAIKRKGDEAWGGMLKRRYQELAGSVSDVLQMMPDRFYLQEEAQRALNVLKITADQSAYFSLNDKVKENFWVTAKEIRDAYYKWNERIPGKEAMKDRWEDRAAAMKELTVCGMTWQVSFAEVEEELYTVFRRIYDNCTDEEEKQKIAERIIEFWRMEYEKTDLERLSLENLQMLRKTELATGRALFPRLEEELAIRLDDKEILHEFFRNIPKYSEMDDWKKQSRSRIIEIKDIFDRLLVQDVNEWKEDFKRWISEEMWLVDHMEFFKKPETLDMQKKRPLYEVYCQYQIEFKESSRERWVENIKKCEA